MLALMGQSPDARITPEIARELCQRTEGAAVVEGSIALLGSQYVLTLKAANCRTGDILGREQITSEDKTHVLAALGKAVTSLRGKLGESLSTVQKYDTPLEEASTHSLEALQAYSVGRKTMVVKGDYAAAVLREALFGNVEEARQWAASALALSNGRDVLFGAGLALALTQTATRTPGLADEMAKRFPESTVVQFNYLPTLRGQIALGRKNAKEAIEALQKAAPYERGLPGDGGFTPAMYPVYVRGEAYLAANRGSEAQSEFQKILASRGVVVNEPIGALAHLGLARAYVLQGDTVRARAAYQDFLTLWNDADPDIPILKAAKAEYAKL